MSLVALKISFVEYVRSVAVKCRIALFKIVLITHFSLMIFLCCSQSVRKAIFNSLFFCTIHTIFSFICFLNFLMQSYLFFHHNRWSAWWTIFFTKELNSTLMLTRFMHLTMHRYHFIFYANLPLCSFREELLFSPSEMLILAWIPPSCFFFIISIYVIWDAIPT